MMGRDTVDTTQINSMNLQASMQEIVVLMIIIHKEHKSRCIGAIEASFQGFGAT